MKSPRELGLPFDDWRPGQQLAIRHCLHARTTHVVINAPTGSGKSTIAAALPRLDPNRRHVALTATKGLQDQYGRTFRHLVDLRGMSNYECRAALDEFRDWFGVRRRYVACDDGPCHGGEKCSLRSSGCDYFDARDRFVASGAGLTNYAAWLSNRRFGQGLGQADRLILDEAHALPEQLMSACRIEIPGHLLDARPPRTWKHWQQWASQKLEELHLTGDDDYRAKRQKVTEALKSLSLINETWAWDSTEAGYTFEPTIPRLLLPLLHSFDGTSTLIYLSATITPNTLTLLGVDPDDVTFVSLPSTFPLARRPIYLRGNIRVDYRTMQDPEQHAAWVAGMDDDIGQRLDRNGLLHSVSFSRGADIYAHSQYRQYMLLHRPGDSAAALVARFKQMKPPCVLVSPSITTGYDFPMAEAEYQIIAKVPFPDTRSKIAKARCAANAGYREHLTMQTLVQTAGRINRSEQDSGETLIHDAHARWFIGNNEELAPQWFLDAVVTSRRAVRPLPKLTREQC